MNRAQLNKSTNIPFEIELKSPLEKVFSLKV